MRVKVKNHVMLRLGSVRPPAASRAARPAGARSTTTCTPRPRPRAGTPSRRSRRWTPRASTWRCSTRRAACSCSASTASSRSGTDGLEPEYATAIARAYNNWMKDFCDVAPDRMFGAGMVAPHDVDGAVRRGAPLRGGARLQGDLPRARDGQPPPVAPPCVRPALGRGRAPRRARSRSTAAARRTSRPTSASRCSPELMLWHTLQPAARHPVRHRVLLRRRHPRALPRPARRAARGQLLVGAVVPVPPRRALRVDGLVRGARASR